MGFLLLIAAFLQGQRAGPRHAHGFKVWGLEWRGKEDHHLLDATASREVYRVP